MITVQMTLDEKLVKRVDKMAQKLRTSRSAFTREALKEAIKRYQVIALEEKHKAGYRQKLVKLDEFDVLEDERVWGAHETRRNSIEVRLGHEDGLSKDCAVNCDHLQTVAKARLGVLITTLSASQMFHVSKAIRFALDV